MAKAFALLSLESVRGRPDLVVALKDSRTQRPYVVWFGRTPEQGPLIGIGKAHAWKRFPGRVLHDGGASFRAFLARVGDEGIRGKSGAAKALEAGFTKMRAIADKFAHVSGPMTLYKGKYYNAKHIAMMEAAGR